MKITLSKSQWEYIGKQCEWIKTAQEEYHGQHTAPTKQDAPLYDLTQEYPEDIYSFEAARLYGDNLPYDQQSIAIIHSCRNKPNKQVKIYRAVPNINANIENEIKNITTLINYVNQYGFLPISDNPKYSHITIPNEVQNIYDKELILEKLYDKKEELNNKKLPPLQINPGDWVTINRNYAKEHGKSNLHNNYKIVSKTVTAKELFTDANSIHEWGYNP